jgi:HEAT repeat protein
MSFDRYLADLTDPEVKLATAELFNLAGLDRESLSKLRETWPQVAPERRRRIVMAAGEFAEDDPEVEFNGLFKITLKDTDAQVRVLGMQGLWEYTGRDLVKPLVELLVKDEDPGVRATAALSLGRYILLGELGELRGEELGEAEVALQEAYENTHEQLEVRARALEALGASSKPFIPGLIEEAHGSGNYRLRLSAIHAMGRNCDVRWLPILLEEMTDDEAEVRYEAVGAAGQVSDGNAIEAIAELLDDDDREVQTAAIEALGHIGGPRVKQHLRPLLRHDDKSIREVTQRALEESQFQTDPLGREYAY